ncbi:signal peptidase II [Rhodococcus aetherivorans]
MGDDGRVTDDPTEHDAHPDAVAEPPVASSSAGTPAKDAPAPARRLRELLALAAVIFGFDLLTKVLAVHYIDLADPVSIVGDTVTLTLVRNPGAAFSMATGMTWLLTLVAVAVVVGVVRIGRTLRSGWWALGLGLVLGGALGNLVDRIFRSPGPLQGHVVDFVSVGWWPVFNVADSAIVCGAILLVALTVFGVEPDGSRKTGSSDSRKEAHK